MKKVLQKNGKRLNKRQYIIFAVILIVATVAGSFIRHNRITAENKFSSCSERIVNLFEYYDEYNESYVETFNSRLDELERDLKNCEEYKLFLNRESRSKLTRFREFYYSFPRGDIEKKLLKCELLRAQLQDNTTNIEKLLDIDTSKRENIEKINEMLTKYKRGIIDSKQILADIFECDLSAINEVEFKFIEVAEELVSNPNLFYEDGEPDYSLVGWDLEYITTNTSTSIGNIERFGLADDTLEEIEDYFRNNNVLLSFCEEDDWLLGNIPEAVVKEECRELLEKTNIDLIRRDGSSVSF